MWAEIRVNGRYAAAYDENVAVTILDLPQQIALAQENIAKAGFLIVLDSMLSICLALATCRVRPTSGG
jgi:hypothetical protein